MTVPLDVRLGIDSTDKEGGKRYYLRVNGTIVVAINEKDHTIVTNMMAAKDATLIPIVVFG